MDIAAREIKPGVTTDYIDKVVHDACIERDVSLALYSKTNFLLDLMFAVVSLSPELLPFP